MKLPTKIFFDDQHVANLSTFDYEFPWASGAVSFFDESLFKKACAVTYLSDYDLELEELGLNDSEEEQIMDQKLQEFGISYEDFDIKDDDRWFIQNNENQKEPMYGVRFDKKGFIEWRI